MQSQPQFGSDTGSESACTHLRNVAEEIHQQGTAATVLSTTQDIQSQSADGASAAMAQTQVQLLEGSEVTPEPSPEC